MRHALCLFAAPIFALSLLAAAAAQDQDNLAPIEPGEPAEPEAHAEPVPAPLPPGAVPRINIALEYGGRLIAATTTLEDGGAVLNAGGSSGEYALVLQSPLPAESVLTAMVGNRPEDAETYGVTLPAGPPPIDAVLGFPARAGDTIQLRLERVTE